MPERDAHRFFLQLISSVVGEANLRDEAVSSANFSYHLIHSCTLTGISPQCWHHPQRYQTRKHFAGWKRCRSILIIDHFISICLYYNVACCCHLSSDNLKLTDFGLATMFRFKGRERRLNRLCGTLPYVAPELLSPEEYRAQPADIWACGIVLTAMLAGGGIITL